MPECNWWPLQLKAVYRLMTFQLAYRPMVAGPADLRQVLEKLVGQRAAVLAPLPQSAVEVLHSGGSGLGYSQLNELPLLLGFDRLTRSFFQLLVDGTTEYSDGTAFKSFDELSNAADRFRQLGLLLFGNVKFAFKVLARDEEQLEAHVTRMQPVPDARFFARHEPIRPIRPIPANRTYYLGYIVEEEHR